MQNNLLSDFFGSHTELSAVDHFMQLMVKTNTFDNRLHILQEQLQQAGQLQLKVIQKNEELNDNIVDLQQLQDNYQIEIKNLKKQLQEQAAKLPLLNNQLQQAQQLQKQSVHHNELLSKKIADLELIKSNNNQVIENLQQNIQIQPVEYEAVVKKKLIQQDDEMQERKRLLSSPKELSCGVWTDPDTGLMWARISIGQIWQSGRSFGNAKKISWFDAESECKKLRLAGYSSWRLPKATELKTLMINQKAGYNFSEDFLLKPVENDFGLYWSSGTGTSGKSYGKDVNFQSGTSYDSFKSKCCYVRAVRLA